MLTAYELDITGASIASDVSSSYMVQEYDDEDGKKTMFTFNVSGTPAHEVCTTSNVFSSP